MNKRALQKGNMFTELFHAIRFEADYLHGQIVGHLAHFSRREAMDLWMRLAQRESTEVF